MYLNKEWAATVSNNTCIKSTFFIVCYISTSQIEGVARLQDRDVH